MINPIKQLYLRGRILIDESFLLTEGLRKAKSKGLEINLGGGDTLTQKNKSGEIRLISYESGVDVRPIIALAADDHPERARRYLDYRKMLED